MSLCLALLLGTAALAACKPSSEPAARRVAQRLILERPTEALEEGTLQPRGLADEWSFASADARAAWRLLDSDGWNSPNGLALRSNRERLRLKQPIQAGSVVGILLNLSSTTGCAANVAWLAGGERQRAAARSVSGSRTQFRIDLGAEQQWTDGIEGLALVLRNCSGRLLSGVAFERLADRFEPESAGAIVSRAWRTTLDGDTRDAVVVLPGIVRRWTLTEAVTSGRLSLGLGVTGRMDAPLSIRIGAVAKGAEEVLLTQRTLEPQDWAENPRWREIEVPVDDLPAGSEILINAATEQPWQPGQAVPLLANPRILTDASGFRPNVLVISIDTLRADRLSIYGHELETTPNIDRRARASGVTFTNVVAPAGWTLPSHVSMFSGYSAVRHGVNFGTAVPTSIPMVAESFADEGYGTVAFTAGGYVSPEFGLTRGFDSFRSRRPERPSVATSKEELSDGVDEFGRWLEASAEEPFFAFFHTYEVHAPYWAREPYFERFGGDPTVVPRGYALTSEKPKGSERRARRFVIPGPPDQPELDQDPADPRTISILYDSAVAFMDSQIERLFQTLEQQGVLDRTLVVLTSDHGEAIGEHDFAGHGSAYDEVTMVPMIFWLPRSQSGRTIDDQVQLVDLVPTLHDLTGVPAPSGVLDGVSLRSFIESGTGDSQRPALIHAGGYGVAARLANRVKYVWHRVPWDYFGPGEEIFDLRADPAETTDLSATDEALRSATQQRLREALEEQLPGLRLTLGNRSVTKREVHMVSVNNRASSVTNLDCPQIEWRVGQRVVVTLAAGSECRVILEHLTVGRLRVVSMEPGAADDAASKTLDLDTAELLEPAVYELSDGGWAPAREPAADALWLTIGWQRPPDSGQQTDLAMDEALTEQLRALGYLD